MRNTWSNVAARRSLYMCVWCGEGLLLLVTKIEWAKEITECVGCIVSRSRRPCQRSFERDALEGTAISDSTGDKGEGGCLAHGRRALNYVVLGFSADSDCSQIAVNCQIVVGSTDRLYSTLRLLSNRHQPSDCVPSSLIIIHQIVFNCQTVFNH